MRIVTPRRGIAVVVAVALTASWLSVANPAAATPPPQTFTWATPIDGVYGVGLTSSQLDAASNVAGPITYAVVSGPGSTAGEALNIGTQLPAGGYVLKATISPTDTTDYVTKSVTVNFTVDKAVLRLIANNASRAYGAADPAFSLGAPLGLENGDTASVITGAPTFSTTATATSAVGSYPITPAQGTLAADNYTFLLLQGDLEIGPSTLTVTASGGSQTYGDTTPPTITPGYSGFINGDTAASSLTTAPTCSANVNAGTAVGTYASTCSGGSSLNYNLQFSPGTVTVNRASLTVTASDASQAYGAATAPAITPVYSGFRNLDDASSLSSAPTCTTSVNSTTPVGSYASTCSGGAGANYTLHYAPGVVTVGQAILTVTASGGAQTYGAATAPAISPSYSGFLNGQTAAILTQTASCTANVNATTAAGTYASTCSGAAAPNYVVHYVNGVVTVNQATLTVTASGGTQGYGDIVSPAITPSYSGFLNGDTAAAISQPAACTAGVNASTPAGVHPNTSSCSGAIAANYTFQYVNGTVTVTKAVLTAKANDVARPFGAANPPFALSGFSGFLNGDSTSSVSGSATIATTATAASAPGAYPITATLGTLSAANYTFVLSPGTLTVEKIIEPVSIVGRAVNKLSVLFYGTLTAPDGTTVVLDNVNCQTVAGGTPITKTLAFGTYAIDGSSCSFTPIIADDYTSAGPITGTFTAAAAGMTTVSLPPGQLGAPYKPISKLAVTGASGTPVWSVVGGSLPPGIALSAAGSFSGTPTTAGVFPFTVKVVVGSAFTETWTYAITVPPMEVTTESLPTGQIGVTYKATLTSNVAKTPAHWTFVGGALPAGLTLSTAGVISGTPTHPGTSTFIVQVKDSASPAHSATSTLSIVIAPMTITTSSLKNGKTKSFYSVPLVASGGTTPRTWAVISGGLPTGLKLSTAGTISGTPTVAGSYSFTVRATDHLGNTATANLSITVA